MREQKQVTAKEGLVPQYTDAQGATVFTRPTEVLRLSSSFNASLARRRKLQPDFGLVLERAEQGEAWALALMASWAELVESDFSQAMKWYEEAALRGHVRSQFMVAHLLLSKCDVKPVDLAIAWLKKTLQTDPTMADALFVLGCVLHEGYELSFKGSTWDIRASGIPEGTAMEDLEGVDLWIAAAKFGHRPAQRRLAFINDPRVASALSVAPNDSHILQ